jgi:SAM-dependent methyltransferase
MTSFRHNGRTVDLGRGQAWCDMSIGPRYQDIDSNVMGGLILEIQAGRPWREAVTLRLAKSFPWLYSIVTSPKRDLFLRQNPPLPGSSILDIGSGWGQFALPLAHYANVTALEPAPERLAFIRAAAAQDGLEGNMCFVQGDLLDIDFDTKFDVACCIGVLEWVPKFRVGDPYNLQLEFLRKACQALAPAGCLILGIENRLGLKYILGSNDDHIGVPLIAVYDRQLAKRKWRERAGQHLRSFTYTRAELGMMLRKAGFGRINFHAAFPDYKLPEIILPANAAVNQFFKEGNFIEEHDGSTGEKLDFQEELKSHYCSLAELEIANEFAPSFFAVAHN